MKNTMLILLLTLSGLISFSQAPKQIPGTEGQKFHDEAAINSKPPMFQFATTDGKFITNQKLVKGKPIVLALFSPTCDHCQVAINAIKEKYNQFKNSTIVFVCSINTFAELTEFVKKVDLKGYPNIYLCAAQDNFIAKFFMPNYILPQVMVYNKQHKLKKIFYEVIQTDSLLTYMAKP